MQPRLSALYVTLLVLLSAAQAGAATPDASPTAGEVHLALWPGRISALPLDTYALGEALCGAPIAQTGEAKCRLTIAASSGGPSTTLELSDLSASIAWQASALDMKGTPVSTSCGVWSVSLILDTTVPQLVSSLVLEPVPGGGGLLASVLKVRIRLHLVNLSTGQVYDDSLLLGFALSGVYSLASSTSSTEATDLPTSNLLVFPDGACESAWILEPSPFLKQFGSGTTCEVCLKAALPASLGNVTQ
ncbi:MAG TPA: hypothetical protein VFE33_04405 [Thermoanaerobaculia bacterium]|nr:hypothetical protein [Thermoanaerobaculia bacterium]